MPGVRRNEFDRYPVTDPDARRRLGAEWGVEPPATPGLGVRALLEEFGDGIRGALVVGENPAVSKRDPEWIERRLDALELLVLVDVARSETTPHADVVLPAASALEKAGTVTNLDRQIQRLQPVEAPPGEARTALRILGELGSRLLDGAAHFERRTPASVFEEMGRVMPMLGGVSYDDIGGSGYRWPDDEAVLYRDAFEAGVAAFVDVQPLLDPSADEALELVTGGRASGADHPDEPPLRVHPDDAARRDVRAGDTVVVSGDGAAVEATADTDDAVRQGTVYLHATVADPLVRAGVRTVTVTSVERPRPE